jgi:hypothetical protein
MPPSITDNNVSLVTVPKVMTNTQQSVSAMVVLCVNGGVDSMQPETNLGASNLYN